MAVAPHQIIEPTELVGLADNALQRNHNSYGLYVSGLAHLRAGELDIAVAQFRDSIPQATSSRIPIHRAVYAPLAIALHHSGRHDEAEEALQKAHRTLEEVIPTVINSYNGKTRKIMTHEWLEFWLLLQEAEQLIRQRPLDLDTTLFEWRERNWEMLNAATDQRDSLQQEEADFDDSQAPTTTLPTCQDVESTETTGGDDPQERMWQDGTMEKLELPLANAAATPKHVPTVYYYRFPEWDIYQTYPVYHPAHEPPNYFDELASKEPVILWGATQRPKLSTEVEWKAAGELVFDWPIAFGSGRMLPSTETRPIVRNPKWYREHDVPVTPEGINPFYRYVVRERGMVEVGVLSCAMCHTRVLPAGTVIKGAQGNLPFSRIFGSQMREAGAIPDAVRGLERNLFGAPWLDPDPQRQLWTTPLTELSAAHATIPPGVLARHRSSPVSPVVVPDLFGLKSRRYLDRTGLQRHRGIPQKDYGNDQLIAAPGFEVPDDHPDKAQIMRTRVNTDPELTMKTRRGTGLYKIPSLRGVWLRGPFEHNGSVATLEDWFDPRRLDDDYAPTGWKGPPGTTTRAVKGHTFGLRLSDEDRAALIAFLRTL